MTLKVNLKDCLMANRIICVKWGDLYSDSDVDILYDKVKSNCSVDFEFECITKFDNHFKPYNQKHEFRQAPEYHEDDVGGIPHYRKLTLFNDDHLFDRNDTILYLDLDNNIQGDLAYFFEQLSNDKPYLVWNYWWETKPDHWLRQYNVTRCPLYNSSVMRWKPGQNKPIYDFLKLYAEQCFFTYPSMDTFMFHQFGPYSFGHRKTHFNYYEQGKVTSQRVIGDNDFWKDYDEPQGIINMLEGLTSAEKASCV